MRCRSCGHGNRQTASFCEACGTRLVPNCPQCGREVRAEARFCESCGHALAVVAAPRASASPEPPVDERRWATVLFADVSGWTAISERMDPEDVKKLADQCSARLAEEVRRYGGSVLRVVGDEILAVFGAPLAHEDDPERAVRAALAMRDLPLDDVGLGAPVRVHVGVTTGEMMAGMVGPPEHRNYDVHGDVVITAARLRSAAPAGVVLVGEETQRATARAVTYRPIPPVEAKGKERPVSAWEALEVAPVPAARPLGTAPLIGRDEELALLTGTWAKVVREAQPHLVAVVGEAGIGKSRLVTEFERRALGAALVLHGRCLPYGEALDYWALASALKEAAGIAAEDRPAVARDRLERLVRGALGDGQEGGLEQSPERADTARFLALLSGLDAEADRAAAPPDQRTLQTAARRFFEALSRRRPLCLILEDVHRASAALLDLIEFVAARASDAPLLIVVQARPELLEQRPAWGRGVRALSSLALAPLGDAAGHALLLALCHQHGLPDDVAEQVGAGAGGNPLFAEELVATVAERGGASGTPSAITALISARLDALPAKERRVLRLGAVFGRTFWPGGLRALGAEGDVLERLEALELKNLLREPPQSHFAGEREFAFKHDLIRDVAYEPLPRAERRSLHGLAADWIEQRAGERVDEHLTMLAHHGVQAEQLVRAVDYLSRAAARAGRAAAHDDELALLAQAIQLAERAGEAERVAELHAQQGDVFYAIGRWRDARAAFEAAEAGLPPDRRAETLVDLAWATANSLDAPAARRHAHAALELAAEIHRPDLAASATGALGFCIGSAGDLAEGMTLLLEAADRAKALGIDPSPRIPTWRTLMLYWVGRAGEAIEDAVHAIHVARGRNDVGGTITAQMTAGLALAGCGRYAEAYHLFEDAERFGREHGAESLVARGLAFSVGFRMDILDYAGAERIALEAREYGRSSGYGPSVFNPGIDLLFMYVRTGRPEQAEVLVPGIEQGVAETRGFHGWLWEIRLIAARAELALARGDWDSARRLADEAISLAQPKGRVKYVAIGLAARARAQAALGRTKEAIDSLRGAVEITRPVGDPAMFLRAATALLDVDGDDALAGEATATAQRVLEALPDPALRAAFVDAEPIRRLLRPVAI